MPTRKKKTHAYEKYQSKRYPATVREVAADMALAARARKKLGKLALGKPKSSRVHKDYRVADGAYQATGKRLAKLTGFKWKAKKRANRK